MTKAVPIPSSPPSVSQQPNDLQMILNNPASATTTSPAPDPPRAGPMDQVPGSWYIGYGPSPLLSPPEASATKDEKGQVAVL